MDSNSFGPDGNPTTGSGISLPPHQGLRDSSSPDPPQEQWSQPPQLTVLQREVHLPMLTPQSVDLTPPLDERTQRHMTGACFGDKGWVLCWLSGYSVLVGISFWVIAVYKPNLMHHADAILLTWLCTILAGVGVPALAYLCMGKPAGVAFGLMAEFYWWGGIGGVIIAVIGEVIVQSFFSMNFPSCNTSPGPDGSRSDDGGSLGCQLFLLIQWIMIPGFWEELFKAVWVFLRFKSQSNWAREDEDRCGAPTATERVPRKTCLGLFDSTFCTFWWRLAETPVAVFLAAMAAGGGFESIENIEYMFPGIVNASSTGSASSASDGHVSVQAALAGNLIRAVLSLHVVWTGYIGLRLAQRQFSSQLGCEKPSWAMTLLPTIVLHALWDWFASGSYLPWFIWMPAIFITSICIVVVPIKLGVLRVQPTPMVEIQVPLEAQPGQQLQVNMPDGRQVLVVVPRDVVGGQSFQIPADYVPATNGI
mmetsp:Transcript_81058/g.127667  ORF Transcript_81058/g.127667 Transcript_81058/m.127667 type:complete len:477 (-) Transcript_81058:35-1465(-)